VRAPRLSGVRSCKRGIKLSGSRISQNNNLKKNLEDQINQQPSSSAPGLTSINTAYFSACKKCKRISDWLMAKDTGKQFARLTWSHRYFSFCQQVTKGLGFRGYLGHYLFSHAVNFCKNWACNFSELSTL